MEKPQAERATLELFKVEGGDDIREYLTKYLEPFAMPKIREDATEGSGFALGNQLCLKCGEGLDGMFGTFQWGICHGEGFCRKCHWPARYYHYLKLPDGTEGRIILMLQYHPDFVKEKKNGASAAQGT